jgi:hypothetical protein
MNIRRFLFFAALALAALSPPPLLSAQSLAKTFTLSAVNQCATIGTSSTPTVGITVTGTSSLTLQPEVAINGGTAQNSSVTSTVSGSTAQATIVTSGATNAAYVAGAGGFDTFLLCVSAYTSGSATVVLNPSRALNAGLLGGAGGGAAVWGAITGTLASQTDLEAALSGRVTFLITLNTQTASYTLALADENALVRMNVATANNLTVPTNATVAFPVGTSVTVRQVGAGTTTIVPAVGVTITTPSSLILRVQYSSAQLVQVAANTWDLIGDTQ